MDLIVAQRIDDSGIYMRDSGKREVFISAAELKVMDDADIKNAIKAALGSSVDVERLSITIDKATGKPLEVTTEEKSVAPKVVK